MSSASVPRPSFAVACALFTTLLFAAVTSANAQPLVCVPELEEALAGSADANIVTGLDAARALAAAVRLVEPALPPLVVVGPGAGPMHALPADDPAVADVRFLAERRLLPPEWIPEALTPATWREMVARFVGWYGLPPSTTGDPPSDDRSLALALAHVLARVGTVIRPAALVVPADPGEGEPGFRGLLWNWTVVPRLVVFAPPPPGATREDSIEALETCARRIRDWFSAPGGVARDLFVSLSGRARMVVIGGEPADDGAWWVPVGEELDVLTFDHPRVQDAEAFAALFDAPVMGVAQLVRLLPRVRTNVSPLRLQRYLQTPR